MKTGEGEELSYAGVGGSRVLIVEARFYPAISDKLFAGAAEVLKDAGVDFERVMVPGCLEIPQALSLAIDAEADFDGAIAIGCVIRGDTAHYDIVCRETNHWLMQVAIEGGWPVGNAVLTVDDEAQATARADGGATGKGGEAARACLRLIALDQKMPDLA